ncbi:MAG: AbrB/MazE/SpoVT family DNA-binding domain-containing protein [Patescibacteria group bacterium]|nr:AbrB/MazE/SpoVT family DNA-binding domain-containing protein [Patescibacteria group bacterium]MBU1160432.1 AbrB/MazE/SpoVT family DNA-binding domain-containing protein [Patescibacteria group bacterium]MBU1349570.1 AbrB/MazE/SpoVT family DNA-binding domain-containing protein [Patescibacteria group bacterium]MBU1421204.1 AbrB/MazE/SpoVT family DNA-binding domain-containing protein [Patescibacteria group bacterium]MBU1683984.1 AbrB/MazE/SpoVT family DNA-binding domain-containing protein [Patesc
MTSNVLTIGELIQPLDKGQITIPIKFRKILGISRQTVLNVFLKDRSIIMTPVEIKPQQKTNVYLRDYTKKEISAFLKEDELSKSLKNKIQKIISQ